MKREHDERAKLIAETTLDVFGEVRREVEIPAPDAPRIDVWLRRLYSPVPMPEFLRLLDQLFPQDCMIEAYCQAVSLLSFWESHRKQYQWRHHLDKQRRTEAEAEAAAQGQRCPELPLLPPPLLWIISAGRPETLLAEYAIAPRAGGPEGIYDLGPGWRIGLIVVNELPTGKQTLLLRMMGSVAVRRAALLELQRLPADDPDLPTLLRIVAALRHTLSHATNVPSEDKEEFMTTAWAEFERYEQKIRTEGRLDGLKEGRLDGLKEGRLDGLKEGRLDGLKEGLCAAVLGLCEVLDIPLSAQQREQLSQLDEAALQQLHDHLKRHRSLPAPR